jgi:hypothetical protein
MDAKVEWIALLLLEELATLVPTCKLAGMG